MSCIGEASTGAYGESGHGEVKRVEVALVLCFCSGFCLLDDAYATKVHRPVDVELRNDGHFRAIPQ